MMRLTEKAVVLFGIVVVVAGIVLPAGAGTDGPADLLGPLLTPVYCRVWL